MCLLCMPPSQGVKALLYHSMHAYRRWISAAAAQMTIQSAGVLLAHTSKAQPGGNGDK